MEEMVKVKCMVNSTVVIKRPEFNVNRKWVKKNQIQAIPFETLEQILWEPGVRRMFESGVLYIEDLKTKQRLGLEPEDVDYPENIIVLDDSDMKVYWEDCPLDLFKRNVSHLTTAQIDNLIAYAVDTETINGEKCRFIKELTGKDILKSISRKQEMQELDERNKAAAEANAKYDGRR